MKKNNAWLMLILLIGLGLACDLDAQTNEANKLVDEANVLIVKNNELLGKSRELLNELLGDNLTKVNDIEVYKRENKSKFDELIRLNEQIEKLGAESTEKFEQAEKLKVPEEYKKYLSLKNQEMKIRTDGHKLITSFVKGFLQTKDVDEINKQIKDFDKSVETIEDADELLKKAEQIKKDNPDIFKTE